MKASSVGLSLSAYQAVVKALRFNFYDEFNRTVEDTDIWTSGGDAGDFLQADTLGGPTSWWIRTDNVANNDRYIHGDGVTKNKYFTPLEDGYTTVTFEARVRLTVATDVSALVGLLFSPIVDYAEPNMDCAHFFMDPAITNTFRARSREAAEEETDTLVALDTAFHKLKIVWTATSVTFYIDDVLVATHVVQVPDSFLMIEFLIRTEAVAVKYMVIDYVRVELS